MKKFLLTLAVAALCSSAALAGEISLQWGADNWPNNSSYTGTVASKTSFGGVTWTLEAFNNNNNGWANVRCGRKTNASVASIYNNEALSYTVNKVVVNTSLEKQADADKLKSAKLYIAKTGNFENAVVVNYDNITEFGDWTFNVPSENATDGYLKVEFDCEGAANNGFIGVNAFTVYVTENVENGGNTEPDQPDNPGGDDNKEGNVTQPFTIGLGFPQGAQATVPTEATTITATDTNIDYTLLGANINTGNYLMIAGKVVEGAYISWSLDFPMSQLQMMTTSGCSTNVESTVNVYAGDNLIGNYPANVQNATITVEIPEAYQAAGTVYKVQSATNKYNQQFASFTYVRVGNEGETPDPDQPDQPTETITVAEALAILEGGQTNVEATVKGIISQIDDVSAQYGNATYFIKDALTDANALEVFRGYWLNGDKFTEGNEIEVGATVVVTGTLVNYNGTYEFTSGSKILSYDAPTGDVPTPPTPETPEGQYVTFDFTNPAEYGFEVEDVTEIDLTGESFESDNVTVSFNTDEGASNPIRFYYGSGNSAGWTMRFYKDTNFTVSVPEGYVLTGIEFDGTNLGKDWTYSNGSLVGNTWTPTEKVSSVTIGKSATGNNPTIKSMTVFYTDGEGGTTGVESIETAEGEAVYFNLQGVRVNNPDRGIFIKVQNGKAVKMVK